MPIISEKAKDADLFICEGMYGEPDKISKAREYKHITFFEAANLAKEANVNELWLTHFSPSLAKPSMYMQQVYDVFANASVGKDGKTVTLNFEEETV
jgi:ribonuclease Z